MVHHSQPQGASAPSIFEQVAERRAIGRTRINREALLFFDGQDAVFPCSVRDVTNSGAGIRVKNLNILPVNFYLSFDKFVSARKCRLVWRDGDFIGAAIET